MIPEIAKPLFDAFASHGEELYLVGGSVRDYFLHQLQSDPTISETLLTTSFKPKDLDFATSALPQKTQEILFSLNMPTYLIGIEYGTVSTHLGDFDAEITTYRCKESYTKGSRKPAVLFGKSIDEDLSRRDFTVNAIAMDSEGRYYDPFCGIYSCVQGWLMTPAEDPVETFTEDPLRMLRAFRFASQLHFQLHGLEMDAIKKMKAEIHNVSAERIYQEMSKLLMGDNVADALKEMGESGLLGEIFPELQIVIDFKQNQGKWHSKLVWPHVLDVVKNSPPVHAVRWGALFHDIAKPQTYSETETGVHFYEHEPKGAAMWNTIADRLKVSNDFKHEINFLIYHHLRFSQLCSVFPKRVSMSALRRFIRDCGNHLDNLFLLSLSDITSHHPDVVKAKRDQCIALKKRLDEIIQQCDVRKLKLPKGLGKEIAAALSLPHGPELGIIMRHLNDSLVAGTLTESSDFIRAAKSFRSKQSEIRENPKTDFKKKDSPNKPKPRLENWSVGRATDGQMSLFGTVYNHPERPDGRDVVTSPIIWVDLIKKTAQTTYTEYDLGVPSEKVYQIYQGVHENHQSDPKPDDTL